MEYAVIKTGGKQYRVSKGDVLEVERLNGKKDETFSFEDVLLYAADGKLELGKPKLDNVRVVAKVLDEVKGEKIRVSRYKSKVRYRKTTGHRQLLTRVKIEDINISGKKEEADKKTRKSAKK